MRLDQKIAALTALPVFRLFEPDALHVLAFSVDLRRARAGETLFRKGEASDGGFLVVEGRIGLNAVEESPKGAASFGPGSLIGEAALIAATERPAHAIAIEPSTLLVLPRSLVHRVLEAHPDSAAQLRRHAAATVAATEFELKTLIG